MSYAQPYGIEVGWKTSRLKNTFKNERVDSQEKGFIVYSDVKFGKITGNLYVTLEGDSVRIWSYKFPLDNNRALLTTMFNELDKKYGTASVYDNSEEEVRSWHVKGSHYLQFKIELYSRCNLSSVWVPRTKKESDEFIKRHFPDSKK